jgi:hypothetical protein
MHSPRPGLNPRTLGPMTSTTIRQPTTTTRSIKVDILLATGKFQFSVPSGNTGLPSTQQISRLTQCLCIHYSLVRLCEKHYSVSNSVACLLVNIISERSRSYEVLKQAYRVHFLVAAVPNKLTNFRFENRSCHLADFLEIC